MRGIRSFDFVLRTANKKRQTAGVPAGGGKLKACTRFVELLARYFELGEVKIEPEDQQNGLLGQLINVD